MARGTKATTHFGLATNRTRHRRKTIIQVQEAPPPRAPSPASSTSRLTRKRDTTWLLPCPTSCRQCGRNSIGRCLRSGTARGGWVRCRGPAGRALQLPSKGLATHPALMPTGARRIPEEALAIRAPCVACPDVSEASVNPDTWIRW